MRKRSIGVEEEEGFRFVVVVVGVSAGEGYKFVCGAEEVAGLEGVVEVGGDCEENVVRSRVMALQRALCSVRRLVTSLTSYGFVDDAVEDEIVFSLFPLPFCNGEVTDVDVPLRPPFLSWCSLYLPTARRQWSVALVTKRDACASRAKGETNTSNGVCNERCKARPISPASQAASSTGKKTSCEEGSSGPPAKGRLEPREMARSRMWTAHQTRRRSSASVHVVFSKSVP